MVAGRITGPWNQGPTFFIEPTLADVYDRAMDNEPVAGIVGTVDIHFGMLGHGSFYSGGDRDIAITRSVIGGETLTDEGFEWNLPEREAAYYQLAEYANDVPGFEQDKRRIDEADGAARRQMARQRHRGAAEGLRHPGADAVSATGRRGDRAAGRLRRRRRARPALPQLQGDRLREPRLVDELSRDARCRARPGSCDEAPRDVPEPTRWAGASGRWWSRPTMRRCPTLR